MIKNVLFFVLLISVKSQDVLFLDVNDLFARDGVKLHARNYFTADMLSKKNPTMLIRTPYNADVSLGEAGRYFAKNGYITVTSDFRGRHRSQGNFSFWLKSGEDAYDTMEWITSKDWSNGEIYTYGISANGIAQYVQPVTSPSWLKGQCPIVATSQLHMSFWPQGAMRDHLPREWLRNPITIGDPTYFDDILVKQEIWDDATWKHVDLSMFDENFNYKSIHQGGWFDLFQKGTLNAFNMYREKNYEGTYLVMNGGGHCNAPGYSMPNQNFWQTKSKELCVALFRGDPFVAKISYYIVGPEGATAAPAGNYWAFEDEWPAYKQYRMYFTKDNKLSATQPTEEEEVTFVYDPNDPTPTKGGHHLFLPCGPQKTNEVDTRADNIIWDSEAFTEYVNMTGNIKVHLVVSSDQVDTDFVCRLEDAYPNGDSWLLLDGNVRMRWREMTTPNTMVTPKPMVPDEKYEIDIDLWSIAYTWNPGHKMRIACTSSNYPKFTINGNSGKLIEHETSADYKTAVNSIYVKNSYVEITASKAPFGEPVVGGSKSQMVVNLMFLLPLLLLLIC